MIPNFLVSPRALFWAIICPYNSMYVVRASKNPNFGPKTSCFVPKWIFLVVQKFWKMVRLFLPEPDRNRIFRKHFHRNRIFQINFYRNRIFQKIFYRNRTGTGSSRKFFTGTRPEPDLPEIFFTGTGSSEKKFTGTGPDPIKPPDTYINGCIILSIFEKSLFS